MALVQDEILVLKFCHSRLDRRQIARLGQRASRCCCRWRIISSRPCQPVLIGHQTSLFSGSDFAVSLVKRTSRIRP